MAFDEITVLDSPTLPGLGTLFQVTMENGSVFTRPFDFDATKDQQPRVWPLVGENGDVLLPASV